MLGPEHPDTGASLHSLGGLLMEQGDYAGARPYLERALAISEAVLGSEHPHTQQVRRNLAALRKCAPDAVGWLARLRYALRL